MKTHPKAMGILRIFLMAAALYACADFLGTIPDNRAQLKDDIEQIKELLTSAYPTASYVTLLEVRTDLVEDKGPSVDNNFQFTKAGYFWEDTEQTGNGDTPIDYWNGAYAAIASSNQALELLNALNQQDQGVKEARAEALLCRAYAHFMLVNIWGETYDPTSDQLGVPYVYRPETEALPRYTRNMVKEVYDRVEADMLEGLKTIGDSYSHPKYHFNKRAAHAFASRFYLIKGDWEKTAAYSDSVFQHAARPADLLRDWYTPQKQATSSRVVARNFNAVERECNLLLNSVSSIQARMSYQRYGLGLVTWSAFFSTSALNFEWSYNYLTYNAAGNSLNKFIPKYEEYFKVNNAATAVGIPYVTLMLFSTDEALLNRAEAYTMMGQYEKAIADLNSFLSTRVGQSPSDYQNIQPAAIAQSYGKQRDRYAAFYTLPADEMGYALLDCILEFRKVEFYNEGLRWFDIKRYHIEVVHKDHERNEYTLTPSDPRRALQIPQVALARGLKPNPR